MNKENKSTMLNQTENLNDIRTARGGFELVFKLIYLKLCFRFICTKRIIDNSLNENCFIKMIFTVKYHTTSISISRKPCLKNK